nr:hypothetical protein [uncultured Dyadobacter sp.]
MRTVALIFMAVLFFTAMRRTNSGSDFKPHFEWKRLVEHAPWAESYNFQMFSLHDTLWVFHPDGTWYSVDGRQWSKSV